MSGVPVIFDPTAVLPPRATTYRRDPGYTLGGPGALRHNYRSLDMALGRRIIAGLVNLPGGPAERGSERT